MVRLTYIYICTVYLAMFFHLASCSGGSMFILLGKGKRGRSAGHTQTLVPAVSMLTWPGVYIYIQIDRCMDGWMDG